MQLSDLTQEVKVKEYVPAVSINDILDVPLTILDYKITSRKNGAFINIVFEYCPYTTRWKKIKHRLYHLFNIEHSETEIRSVHGYYSMLIEFLKNCESIYDKGAMLPLNNVVIERKLGYYFQNSSVKV